MEHEVRQVIHAGLLRLMNATNVLWPGMDRQLPERNLSLYVAAEFLRSGYTVLTEWPWNRNEHIDLIAYRPAERSLVLLESKRAWGRSLELNGLWNDVGRLERAAVSLDAWTSDPVSSAPWKQLDPDAILGVVLVSSTAEDTFSTTRQRSGGVDEVVSRIVGKVGTFDHVAHPDKQYPYVLHHAAWRIR